MTRKPHRGPWGSHSPSGASIWALTFPCAAFLFMRRSNICRSLSALSTGWRCANRWKTRRRQSGAAAKRLSEEASSGLSRPAPLPKTRCLNHGPAIILQPLPSPGARRRWRFPGPTFLPANFPCCSRTARGWRRNWRGWSHARLFSATACEAIKRLKGFSRQAAFR